MSQHAALFFPILLLASAIKPDSSGRDYDQCSSNGDVHHCPEPASTSLLQADLSSKTTVVSRLALREHARGANSQKLEESCSEMKNQGSYFTVQFDVGTPPQSFDVVADTGSDSPIITSCICADKGWCKNDTGRCFKGTQDSTHTGSNTFLLKKTGDDNPAVVDITFGSGTITAVVASDRAAVGSTSTTLEESLLLMVDRRKLDIEGVFEGILGLGLPRKRDSTSQDQMMGLTEEGFLETAEVKRFSMCFNDGSRPGALRLNIPALADPLGSMGTVHWGLGMEGIRIGNAATTTPIVCGHSSGDKGSVSPCGAIPDSGTTLILGPEEQVQTVLETICDQWPRCVDAVDAASDSERAQRDWIPRLVPDALTTLATHTPKHEVLRQLLYDCANWINTSDSSGNSGVDELPTLHFDLMGKGDGERHQLNMTGWAYLTEMKAPKYGHHTKYLGGLIPVDIPEKTDQTQTVCAHAFGVQDYTTAENGPVWILGSPLFYENIVSYDMDSDPPSMAISQGDCNACEPEDGNVGLITSKTTSSKRRSSKVRVSNSPPLVRRMDVSKPL